MQIKRITSKFIQFLLTIVTTFSLLPLTAMAAMKTEIHIETQEETPKHWDAMADTSWYNERCKEFHISTPEQLAGLAVLVNTGHHFEGQTICLKNDIDLSGHNWVSIGDGQWLGKWYDSQTKKSFWGTFDGQNHYISNLTTNSSNYAHGLFGLAEHGIIKNVRIIDAYIYNNDASNHNCIGILADEVRHCNIFGSYTTGQIIDYSTNVKYVGGLVGDCYGTSKIIGCYSTASILNNSLNPNYKSVGGIIGCLEYVKYIGDDAIISNCWYDGSIQCKGSPFTGGILGSSDDDDVKINNCFVSTTDIICQTSDRVALITTTGTDDSVSDCYWPASKTAQSDNMKIDPVNKISWFSKDTSFDTSKCGMPIENFNDPFLIDKLNEKAGPGVEWESGVNHPTLKKVDDELLSKKEEVPQEKRTRWQKMFKRDR